MAKRSLATLRRKAAAAKAAAAKRGDRSAGEPLPQPKSIRLSADIAREFWDLLTADPAITGGDVVALTVLCETWTHYCAALEQLKDLGTAGMYHEIFDAQNQLTGTKPHALFTITGDLRSQLLRQLDKFPLTPATRALIIGKGPAANGPEPQSKERTGK